MNKKQLAFVLFLLWSAINTVILFKASDESVRYVAGEIGEWIVIMTFVLDLFLCLVVLVTGFVTIYEDWFGDD